MYAKEVPLHSEILLGFGGKRKEQLKNAFDIVITLIYTALKYDKY